MPPRQTAPLIGEDDVPWPASRFGEDSFEDRRIAVESSTIMGAVAAITGLIVGVVFGLVLLLASPWGALLVLVSGLVGAGLGGAVFSIASGRVDVRGAWQALLRR